MKLTKSQFKQIIKEELDAAMLDAYIDNPTDLTMPEEVAFHPEMIKARTEFYRERAIACKQEYDKARGIADAANPVRNPELTSDSWDQVEGAEEKQKELNRIISQLNKMMMEQDFETVKQNPKFQELVARQEELIGVLKNSRDTERAAGSQIGGVVHNWIRSMMNQGPSKKCVGLFGLQHDDPDAAVPYAMERWNINYRRTDREGDYGRSQRDRQSRDREEQAHQDKIRRLQRDRELADLRRPSPSAGVLSRSRNNMKETTMKITKSQLKQIIMEEIARTLTTEQEEVDVQNLEALADTVIDTVKREAAKAGSQANLLMQLVLTKLQEEAAASVDAAPQTNQI